VPEEINDDRRRFLAATAATVAAAQLGLARVSAAAGKDGGELASLETATAWLNSAPLTAAGLRGKVVLASFWTYTCINWLRSQPYLRAWAEKYRDRGLVVIGVHSPEFGFEKDLANVRRAAQALRVDYPIAVDSNHAIWKGFDNQYWPALYFVDAKGRIQHHQFGEGRSQAPASRPPPIGPACGRRRAISAPGEGRTPRKGSSITGLLPVTGRWGRKRSRSTAPAARSGIGFTPGIFTWSWGRLRPEIRSDSGYASMVKPPVPPTASTSALRGPGRSPNLGCIS